ncbi:hypothetical protein CBR_g19808 [Chara braunii]|uniref:Hydroxylamine reductase n=1 Tax=Chara braunii TaxID=69332 RepID=A0A388JTY8_CHABU|nr:hypothetical protein CBR_g19808 [Chara braunii]|eukprot:GBG61276.1 hypothetical protein CBR_g19808 [Chara braunii]
MAAATAFSAGSRHAVRGLMRRAISRLSAVSADISSSSSGSSPGMSAGNSLIPPNFKEFLGARTRTPAINVVPMPPQRSTYRTYRSQAAGTTVTKEKVHEMFCFQCEQTKDGVGCTTVGVCGKDPKTAALQDVLLHSLKGLSQYAVRAKAEGISDPEMDSYVQEAIFATLTNVNFDPKAIQEFINTTIAHRENIKAKYEAACQRAGRQPDMLDNAFTKFLPSGDVDALAQQGTLLGLDMRRAGLNEDIFSLQELLTYGIKGMAAYAAHAHAVGEADAKIGGFIHEAFDYISKPTTEQTLEELLALCLKCGEVNMTAMEILNKGHIHNFGTPEPTKLRTTPVKGKCILVSGHDLKDLYELLKATEGMGINVYTHGEMLPAHGYPEDTLVMTLACGKYRFNKQFDSFGTLEGSDLPRLMDIGQCNDAYSAIRIAAALAQAMNTDINSLPLSMVLSWFEQKAVAVLLTLLHLGVQNIRIGPKLPAFVSPNILNIIVEKYKLTPISGPEFVEDDIRAMLSLSSSSGAAKAAASASPV